MAANYVDTKDGTSSATCSNIAKCDRETSRCRNLWAASWSKELRKLKAADLRRISRSYAAVGRGDGHRACMPLAFRRVSDRSLARS